MLILLRLNTLSHLITSLLDMPANLFFLQNQPYKHKHHNQSAMSSSNHPCSIHVAFIIKDFAPLFAPEGKYYITGSLKIHNLDVFTYLDFALIHSSIHSAFT